jgi:hypothetical protein
LSKNRHSTCDNFSLILDSYVREQDDFKSQELLHELLEIATPTIKHVIRFRASYFKPEDVEEMQSDVILLLLKRLGDFKLDPQKQSLNLESLEEFSRYVAVISYNVVRRLQRERHPARWSLKNKINSLLSHNSQFATWETEDGLHLCGFIGWRRQDMSISSEDLHILRENPLQLLHQGLFNEDAEKISPIELVEKIFTSIESPIEVDTLVSVISELWGIKDEQSDTFCEQVDNHNPEFQLELRTTLSRLWNEICELPHRQRTALLLNLRDMDGFDCVTLLPYTRTASIEKIAEVLEIPLPEFAQMWPNLPLDDESIAGILGASRQQVINLRRVARDRLARRMAATEKKIS